MSLRGRVSWKRIFYGAIMRRLREADAARADQALATLGRSTLFWPPCRRRVATAAARASQCLRHRLSEREFTRLFAENWGRTAARDYLLDGLSESDLDSRFTICGSLPRWSPMFDQYESVIFVGCHLGAYIPALHWLCRRVEGLRMVVQRPSHVGDMLATRFADEAGPFPQSLMLLRRGLSPAEGARRVLTARSALRAGLSLYLCGDIPWPKGYEVECLGSHPRFSGLWADLAAETRRPVVLVFARFEPGGRYRVELDAPFSVDPSNISWAVTHYARRLDRAVATFPEQAVAYWTWPAYDPHAVEKTRSKNEDDNAHVVAHTQYQARSISGIPVAQTLPALRGPVA